MEITHNKLKEGGTYLFERTNETNLTEITILTITEKSIKVRYVNGHETWLTRQRFDNYNTFVEDITKLPIKYKPYDTTPLKEDFGVLELNDGNFHNWYISQIHFNDKAKMIAWLDELKAMVDK